MKKLIFLLVLVIVVCTIVCCKNNSANNKLAKVIPRTNKIIDIHLNAISPLFLDKIKDFILYADSMNYNDYVIVVFGYSEDEDCYIVISTSYIYDTQTLLGYVIIDNKLVAFCCPQAMCSRHFFDITKMKTNKIIEGFRNEGYLDQADYSPINHVYLVHNKDSLELISKGYY